MLSQVFEKYKLSFAFGSVALLCFFLGLVLLLKGRTFHKVEGSSIEIIDSENRVDQNNQLIYVDIQGAIKVPGVYEMHQKSRIIDLIAKSGGYTDDADQEWLARNLNQAQVLQDGTKIYIPFKGETLEDSSDGLLIDKKININTASIEQLESLTGIGEKRAQQIIDSRPYGSIQELLEKGVVGEKTFEAIKDQISLY